MTQSFAFKKAVKSESKLRLALIGPSGSGKTFTALTFARTLAKKRIAVIDTERGSAAKYADLFDFDALELERHAPSDYCAAIESCVAGGEHDVLIIDSLSHAWMGKDGALEQVDKEAARSVSKNSFSAWRTVTPMHNRLVDALVSPPMHVIATMRSKAEWVVEKDEKTGKSVPRKIGTAAVQRDGLEYEFDVVADMDHERNLMVVSKSRCPDLAGQAIEKPGAEVAELLQRWLAGSASAYGLAVNAVMVARTLADLAAAGELAKALSGADKERVRPIFAARRERIVQAAAAAERTHVVTAAETQPPEQGEAHLPVVDPPHIDDADSDLMPHDVFAVDDVGDLPPSLFGAIAYVDHLQDHWLMAEDGGTWTPPASAHDRQQLRAVAEAFFANRGWDHGPAGKVDIDAGGRRLLEEVRPQPTQAPAPTKAPSGQAAASEPQLSPHLPSWATPRELQGVVAAVKDAQGKERRVWLFTEALIKADKAKEGDLMFRFLPGAADKPQLFEWSADGSWNPLPLIDPLFACVREALAVDVKHRNKTCQMGTSMLLAFAQQKVTEQKFSDLKELTPRSMVLLRAAMAELQKTAPQQEESPKQKTTKQKSPKS